MEFILFIGLILMSFFFIIRYQNYYDITFTTWNTQAIWMLIFLIIFSIPIIIMIYHIFKPTKDNSNKWSKRITLYYFIMLILHYILPEIAYFTK